MGWEWRATYLMMLVIYKIKKMVGDDNLQNNVLEKNDQFVYKIHPDVLSKALGI